MIKQTRVFSQDHDAQLFFTESVGQSLVYAVVDGDLGLFGLSELSGRGHPPIGLGQSGSNGLTVDLVDGNTLHGANLHAAIGIDNGKAAAH